MSAAPMFRSRASRFSSVRYGVAVAALLAVSFAAPPAWSQVAERARTSLAPMLKKVTPAVVNIAVMSRVPVAANPLLQDPFFRQFFGNLPNQQQPQSIPQQAAGSGVIIDATHGYVITNHHVIDKADEITVTLNDKRHFKAKLIGSDSATDIALLQIDADHLTQLDIGNSDTLQVGDYVVAIGNPFGLGQTVTAGIVSALGRTGLGIEGPGGYEDFIQTDAAVNPGNSGGALVDLDGKLVGINTAIVAAGGRGNVGIGFAVPINMAQRVTSQLQEYGEVRRGRIGIGIQDVTQDLSEALKLDVQNGAIVTQVEPGSPGERAGIKVGDVVTELDGVPLQGAGDLRNKVGLMRLGTDVSLTLLRDGRKQNVMVKIEAAPAAKAETAPSTQGSPTSERLEGAQFRNLERGDPPYGKVTGVLVAAVDDGSPAAFLGLREGDVVTAVNRQNVANMADFERAIRAAGTPVALNVWRDGARLYLVIR
jgi:serine protease DegQ